MNIISSSKIYSIRQASTKDQNNVGKRYERTRKKEACFRWWPGKALFEKVTFWGGIVLVLWKIYDHSTKILKYSCTPLTQFQFP